jgi:hypothetical protein
MQRLGELMAEENYKVQYWFSLPRVWEGWCRVLNPEGRLYCDCREDELDGVLEGLNEFHPFYRDEEWRKFLQQKFCEQVAQLDCSPRVN